MKKFDNYKANLDVLIRADREDLTNEFIVSGIIDKFSMQFELGWKVMKEILRYEGRIEAATGSPRDIIKAAYATFDFMEEAVWLSMLRDRNDISHIYNGKAALELVDKILKMYIPEFVRMREWIDVRYEGINL